MSTRNKIRLERINIYLKKNVFNGRYVVRNILALTVLLTVATVIYGIGSLGNKADKEAHEDAEVQAVNDEQTVLEVKDVSRLDSASIDVLLADMDTDNDVDIEAKETEMLADAYKEFSDKCVVITDNVNVREEADTESGIVGKMNDGAVGTINSTEGEWLNITSGDVTGYVKSEFVKTGDAAYDYAKNFYRITAVVTEDGVNVRKEASTDSDVIAAAYTGIAYQVDKAETESADNWVCVLIDGTNKGYINADYIEVTEGYPVATVFEVVEEKTEETQTIDNASSDNQTTEKQQETTEEQTTEAPAANNQTTEAPATDNQTTVAVTARGSVALSEEDINLMAAVMTLECGSESYEGQLAVANVILNRLQSGAWGSTMSAVVYAPSQFTVVNLPSFNTYISPSCLQAARDACAGTNNIGGYMSFRPLSNVNTSNLGSYTIIGNHCFF